MDVWQCISQHFITIYHILISLYKIFLNILECYLCTYVILIPVLIFTKTRLHYIIDVHSDMKRIVEVDFHTL
jgi:hypothetical protein